MGNIAIAITLCLKPESLAQLTKQAQNVGQTVEEYLTDAIENQIVVPPITNGAELVAYWERNGLIGDWANRADITDSVEYARQLRREAETREHD